jgi:hypothetical protein
VKDYINCINKSWDEDDQKTKFVSYEIEEDIFVVYDSENHRKDSSFDLAKKNQFMEMDVFLADNLPHFKFITDDGKSIWHFMIDYKNSLGFYSHSGDCNEGSKYQENQDNSDFEDIENDFQVSYVQRD